MDVWTRDLRQVVDHVLKTVKPDSGKITLVGYSLGTAHVVRYLDPNNTAYGNNPVENIGKIDRAILIDGLTTLTPTRPNPSFPLVVSPFGRGLWSLPPGRDIVCGNIATPGVAEQLFAQQLAVDPIGSSWGAAGLARSPTFNSYGMTLDAMARFPVPILVSHASDDGPGSGGFPWQVGCNLYRSVSGVPKMMLTIDCASHGVVLQSCSGVRCGDESSRPYGQDQGPWRGPRATIQAAVVEWITNGTVAGLSSGPVFVDASGNAAAHSALADKLAADNTCPVLPP
jgi:pimeloyl-ACP methyl ester carboxylesterase